MEDRAIVAEALEAMDSGLQIPLFTARDAAFGLADAYRVAARICEAREARGEKPVGRKIGFTNRAAWPAFKAAAPMWGYMYDTTVFALGAQSRASLARLCEPRIEPEIVFGLARAPALDMDEAALAGCVGWVAHGFELVHSIFPAWTCAAPDAVAGFGLHAASWIGPRHDFQVRVGDWRQELTQCAAEILRNGEAVDRGAAANVLDRPLNALKALVALLADDRFNPPLAAGEIVTTGSFTRAMPVAPGEVWTTRLSGVPLEGARLALTA